MCCIDALYREREREREREGKGSSRESEKGAQPTPTNTPPPPYASGDDRLRTKLTRPLAAAASDIEKIRK